MICFVRVTLDVEEKRQITWDLLRLAAGGVSSRIGVTHGEKMLCHPVGGLLLANQTAG